MTRDEKIDAAIVAFAATRSSGTPYLPQYREGIEAALIAAGAIAPACQRRRDVRYPRSAACVGVVGMTPVHPLLAIAERESRTSEAAALIELHTALCETFAPNFTPDAGAVHGRASAMKGVQQSAAPIRPAQSDRAQDSGSNGGLCGRSSLPAGGSRAKAGVAPASSPGLDLSPSSSHPLVREAPDVPPVVGLCCAAARVPVISPARAAASDLREVRR